MRFSSPNDEQDRVARSNVIEFHILTLFPGYFVSPFSESILGKAQEKGLVTINIVDIRDYAEGKHRVADDYPFGGGEGMVLKPEPIARALTRIAGRKRKNTRVILLSPQGVLFSQGIAKELAGQERIVLICGHYEGVDERVAHHLVDMELSIGDYVISGGEGAAAVVVEAVSRLVPGVLGNPDSPNQDSFSGGLLKWPVYTRPREFEGWEVPPVLVGGDHREIERWRRKEMLRRTRDRRQDLWKQVVLTETDRDLLAEIDAEDEDGGGYNESH